MMSAKNLLPARRTRIRRNSATFSMRSMRVRMRVNSSLGERSSRASIVSFASLRLTHVTMPETPRAATASAWPSQAGRCQKIGECDNQQATDDHYRTPDIRAEMEGVSL